MREGSNGRALLAPSLAQKRSPGLQQSRTHSGSSGCSGGRLRLPVDMLSSWLAMALMLVSATTWATGMQETQCGTAVVEFSPQTGFKTKPCCLKSPLIPVSGKSSHFVGPQCRFCSEASSCPHKRITQALSKGEEFFWLIQRKRLLFQGNKVSIKAPGLVLKESTTALKGTPRSKGALGPEMPQTGLSD